MSIRRGALSLVVLGIASTAPTGVRAATDVEGVGYAGTNVGGWACGPVGRVKYAGGGGRVRVVENRTRLGGTGWAGEIAGAAERESTTLVGCDGNCTPQETVLPPDQTLFGGHARAGYRWPHVGLEGGLGAFQAFRDHADRSPTIAAAPEVELSVGDPDRGRAVLGVGSPLVTMERRPGLYLGADLPIGPVDAEVRLGTYRAGPGILSDAATRADVVAYVPVTEGFSIRAGAALTANKEGSGGEGSVGFRGSL